MTETVVAVTPDEMPDAREEGAPRAWWRIMDTKIGIVSLPVFVVIGALIIGFLTLGKVPSDLTTNIAVLAAGGVGGAGIGGAPKRRERRQERWVEAIAGWLRSTAIIVGTMTVWVTRSRAIVSNTAVGSNVRTWACVAPIHVIANVLALSARWNIGAAWR